MKATCGGCDSEWPGETRRAHCSACHATFANAKLFDRHRWHNDHGEGCSGVIFQNLTLIDGTWYDAEDAETS